jgi:cytochrome c oxidase subunit I
VHYWWPKMTGRLYPEAPAKIAAGLTFIGFNLTFFPQFVVGFLGNPRRYHFYPDEWQVWHIMSTAGASILAVGYGVPLFYLLWSLKYGKKASADPWRAVGLEWMTASPPPTTNFKEIPIVTWEAYEYDEHSEHTEAEAQRDREIMPGAEAAARQEAARNRHPAPVEPVGEQP